MQRLRGFIDRYYPIIFFVCILLWVLDSIIRISPLAASAISMAVHAGAWIYLPLAVICWALVLLGVVHECQLLPGRLTTSTAIGRFLNRFINVKSIEDLVTAEEPVTKSRAAEVLRRWSTDGIRPQ